MLSWDQTSALAAMRCERAWVEIDLAALAHNVQQMKQAFGVRKDLAWPFYDPLISSLSFSNCRSRLPIGSDSERGAEGVTGVCCTGSGSASGSALGSASGTGAGTDSGSGSG